MNNNLPFHAVVVLPTYNEVGNIEAIVTAILQQSEKLYSADLSILVVDDNSPDGTGAVVRFLQKKDERIHLLSGVKKGLGKSYVRGMTYAIEKLHADIVIEMDADFSHDPQDIPRLVETILEGNDFVIGSRYAPKGTIPHNWSYLRKLNSKAGNFLARYITGMRDIKDCTGGFRAIKTSLLKKIDLSNIHVFGYAFQINLLYLAQKHHAKIVEIPIHFYERKHGESKLKIKDIIEFILSSFTIRFPILTNVFYYSLLLLVGFTGGVLYLLLRSQEISIQQVSLGTLLLLTLLLIFQGIFSLYWMIYGWNDSAENLQNKVPELFLDPKYSFSAIIPARHEASVIKQTLQAMVAIQYPEQMKEVIVVCREDDIETIEVVKQTITLLHGSNIKLVIFNDSPINKPHSLNIGLEYATKQIVAVFDAEDEPHPFIYQVINTIYITKNSDVIQSGVQLMNYKSNWFSTLNVLEYFFWFKSSLHYLSSLGVIPLGGNTVFFKKAWLKKLNGWDEECLTEDAEIGIRLSSKGAKIDVVYDEKYVTKEETPHDLTSFIKQRTRWNQGFLQVLLKGEWLKLPTLSKRLLAFYILVQPQIQAALFLYVPISLLTALFMRLPVVITMLMVVPMYILIVQLCITSIGLYEFTKSYQLRYSLTLFIKLIATFYFFQLILGFSALRASLRMLKGEYNWEKTLHLNTHRKYIVHATI